MRARFGWFWLGFLLMVVWGVALGQVSGDNDPPFCDPANPGQWRAGSTYFPNPAGAAQYQYETSSYGPNSNYVTVSGPTLTCQASDSYGCTQIRQEWQTCWYTDPQCASPTTRAGTIYRESGAVSCSIPPQECDPFLAGNTFTASTWQALGSSPGPYCSPISNCLVDVKSSTSADGSTVWTLTHTDTSCTGGETPAPAAEEATQGESCIPVGNGEYCASPSGSGQCGYLNDNPVCLANTPDDGCQVLADGSKVCGTSAGSPPAPDNGTTPGVPAPPDQVIVTTVNGDTITNNYYSSSTVAGSARQPGDPVGTQGATGTSSGMGGSGGTGTGTGEEGGEEGGQPNELEEVDSFQDATQAFWNRVDAAPIVAAYKAAGGTWPTGGSCPTGSLNLGSIGLGSFSLMEWGCGLWATGIAPLISLIMAGVWAFIGIRIAMSA